MIDFLLIDPYKFEALSFANSLCELFVHLFLQEVLQNGTLKSLCKILNALFGHDLRIA